MARMKRATGRKTQIYLRRGIVPGCVQETGQSVQAKAFAGKVAREAKEMEAAE